MTRLKQYLRGEKNPGKSGARNPHVKLLNSVSRHTSNLGPSSESPAKASSKLLSSVDDVFNKMDNPYYKLPDTPEQALEADRMLMTWKAAGRQWRDIVAEWTRISGRPTDESNISVRHLIQEKYAHSSKEFVSRSTREPHSAVLTLLTGRSNPQGEEDSREAIWWGSLGQSLIDSQRRL